MEFPLKLIEEYLLQALIRLAGLGFVLLVLETAIRGLCSHSPELAERRTSYLDRGIRLLCAVTSITLLVLVSVALLRLQLEGP